jgi:hypothetical protein
MKKFFLLLLCLTLSAPLHAQLKGKELQTYLDGVSERGRLLYEYDQAAWHGTDAFFELKPDTLGLGHYVCIKQDNGWSVLFGSWNEAHTKFLIRYQADELNHTGKFTAKKYDLPKEAPASVAAMERAIDLVLTDFHGENRSYNLSVLPTPENNFYVYVYPAQVNDSIWPLGGDVRYIISTDGSKIMEKRQLHKTIIEVEFDPSKSNVFGYHTHVLSDVPEDTDVLCVLSRKPLLPEIISAGKNRVFSVETDGSIRIVKK